MEIFKPTIQDQATFSGSVDISGSLTITQNLNVVGELQGAATTASYISLANVDGFTDVSSSIEQRISRQELFSGSLDNTFATEAEVANAVSSLNAATSSYALQADISGSFTSVSESLAGRITSNESSVSALNSASSSYLFNTTDTLTGTLTVTNVVDASSVTIADALTHKTDTHTRLEFASDQIKLNTSGSTRVNITNSGVDIFDGLDMNSTKITQVQDPTSAQDAATKNYVDTSVSSLNSATGSYLLNTTDTLDGDLTVTGRITAQEFHTEFISSSILHESGSTVFGNSADDTHVFTGNILQGNTVVNPASGFADQTGIGLKYSTTTPSLEVSSDSVALNLNRTTTGGAGIIAELRSANNVVHSFGTATSYMLGNVGIGTTSPGQKLEINQGGTGNGEIVRMRYNGSYYTDYGSNKINWVGANQTFSFQNNGSTAIYVNSSSNVGIGTTSPSVQLDIEDSGNVIIDLNTTTANANTTIRLQESGNNTATIGYDGTNDGLVLTTGGFTAGNGIFIDNAQNVGIGTKDFGLSSYTGWDNLRLGKTGNLFFNTTYNNFGFAIGRNFYFASDASYKYLTADEAERINFQNGEITFSNATSGTEDSGLSWNVNMVLDVNGNLGIGTTSPAQKLHVVGDIRMGTSGVGSILRINRPSDGADAGNVGFFSTSANSDFGLRNGSGGGDIRLYSNDGSLRFYTGASYANQVFRITNSGNVGIGTTSPTQKLHVGNNTANSPHIMVDGLFSNPDAAEHGRVYFNDTNFGIGAGKFGAAGTADDDLYIWAYNGTGRDIRFMSTDAGATAPSGAGWHTNMIIESQTSGGKVGIGTSSPSAKLDVGFVSGGTSLLLRNGDISSGTGNDVQIKLGFNDSDDYAHFIRTRHNSSDSNNAIDFYTCDGTQNNSLTSGVRQNLSLVSGNVGIGVTEPSKKLTVRQDVNGDPAILKLENKDGNSNNGAFIGFSTGYDGYATIGAKREGAENDSSLIFSPMLNESAVEKMRITSAGNVGIGTTSPRVKLEVSGDIYQSWADAWKFVGQVYQDGGSYRNGIATNSATRTTQIEARSAGIDGEITFFVGTSEVARMVHGGNIGIGTTNPVGKVHVVSSTTSNSGMTNHNGTNTHSVSGVKLGSTSQKLRVFVENYSTGLLNFSYAHTNSGSCGASLLVYINNSYGTIATNTIHSDLTFCQGTITISTYSPGGGASGAFYEITMPTANGSAAYWAATITGAGNFYFNVI